MKNSVNKRIFRFGAKMLALITACLFLVSTTAGCNDNLGNGDLYDPFEGVNTSKPITALVKGGRSDYKIVIPAEPSETEEYAASEMQKYVKESTGVDLNIVKDNAGVSLGQELLCIGDTKFVDQTKLVTKDLNKDGFRIKTKKETILIKGENDRGTLYGVYDFLEKFIGVRFLSVDYEHVPQLEEIPLYEMDIVEIPDIQSRSHNGGGANSLNPAQNAKRRMVTGLCSADSSKYGGGFKEEWATSMHSYDQIVPFSTYGEAHPEWYTKTGYNSGDSGGNQWELSNGLTDDGTVDETMEESLLKTAIENIKEFLLASPEATYVGLGQNDNMEYCRGDHCEGKCLRQRELFGGHSAHAIVFANAVIREINAWLEEMGDDRNVEYVIYAYQYTETAPDPTAPRHDLAIPHEDLYIMACPYLGHYYNAPLNDELKNSKFYGTMTAWQKITDRVSIFDYVTNFNQPLAWFPNVGVLKTNLQWYKELGALRVVSDDVSASVTYKWLLIDYILVRLMWNVDRDVNEIIGEFNRLFYGEAAGEIMDEFVGFNEAHFTNVANSGRTWQGAACTANGWLHSTTTLNVDYLRQAQRLLDAAKEAINADETLTEREKTEYLDHMLYAEIQVDHMKFINYGALFSTTDEADKEFYQSYYNKLKTLKVTKLGNYYDQPVTQIFSELGVS